MIKISHRCTCCSRIPCEVGAALFAGGHDALLARHLERTMVVGKPKRGHVREAPLSPREKRSVKWAKQKAEYRHVHKPWVPPAEACMCSFPMRLDRDGRVFCARCNRGIRGVSLLRRTA